MGSLFGSTKKTTTTDEGPWKDQAPYVKDALSKSQGLFNAKSGTAAYAGDTYANANELTTNAAKDTGVYAAGAGKDAADATTLSGMGLLGQSGNYMDSLGAYGAAAGADNTASNIKNAGMYADNPYLSGQIDAATRDVGRNLNENTLPGIDRAAVGSGNINSSRAGIAEGIAMRGAQDQAGDIAANMRGNAYNQGIQTAANDAQFRTNSMGQASNNLGAAVQSGVANTAQGVDTSYQNLGKSGLAGGVLQADEQGQLSADQNQWNANDTREQGLLNNYYGTIGANNWGKSGNTTEETKSNPGIFGAAMGLGSLAASFMAPGAGALGGMAKGALSGAFQNAQSTPVYNFQPNLSPFKVPGF